MLYHVHLGKPFVAKMPSRNEVFICQCAFVLNLGMEYLHELCACDGLVLIKILSQFIQFFAVLV